MVISNNENRTNPQAKARGIRSCGFRNRKIGLNAEVLNRRFFYKIKIILLVLFIIILSTAANAKMTNEVSDRQCCKYDTIECTGETGAINNESKEMYRQYDEWAVYDLIRDLEDDECLIKTEICKMKNYKENKQELLQQFDTFRLQYQQQLSEYLGGNNAITVYIIPKPKFQKNYESCDTIEENNNTYYYGWIGSTVLFYPFTNIMPPEEDIYYSNDLEPTSFIIRSHIFKNNQRLFIEDAGKQFNLGINEYKNRQLRDASGDYTITINYSNYLSEIGELELLKTFSKNEIVEKIFNSLNKKDVKYNIEFSVPNVIEIRIEREKDDFHYVQTIFTFFKKGNYDYVNSIDVNLSKDAVIIHNPGDTYDDYSRRECSAGRGCYDVIDEIYVDQYGVKNDDDIETVLKNGDIKDASYWKVKERNDAIQEALRKMENHTVEDIKKESFMNKLLRFVRNLWSSL